VDSGDAADIVDGVDRREQGISSSWPRESQAAGAGLAGGGAAR
jgi:hypothetical protein